MPGHLDEGNIKLPIPTCTLFSVIIKLALVLRFGPLAIPFTPLCQCLSEETLKAVGPFYLVSMPGEVKDPTSPHWNV